MTQEATSATMQKVETGQVVILESLGSIKQMSIEDQKDRDRTREYIREIIQSQKIHDEKMEQLQVLLELREEKRTTTSQSTGDKKSDSKGGERKEDTAKSGAPARRDELVVIKRHFSTAVTAQKDIDTERKRLRRLTVNNTGTWICENETYRDWEKGHSRILWLSGPPGIGKSVIANAVAERLQLKTEKEDGVSVACFFFKEANGDLQNFANALECCILQISKQSTEYRNHAAEVIMANETPDVWEIFIKDKFSETSDSSLFWILDGIDEADNEEQAKIVNAFKDIMQNHLNIQVMFTGRPQLESELDDLACSKLEISKESIMEDIQTLCHYRIEKHLKRFHRNTRKYLEDQVVQNADTMLYVDLMTRRFSDIARESSVIKDVKKNIPKSLEDLFRLLIDERKNGCSETYRDTRRMLYTVLTYAVIPLRLDLLTDLVARTDKDSFFDVEDEISGRLARFVDLTGDEDSSDDESEHDSNPTTVDEDSISEALAYSQQKFLTFRERSMREYFRQVHIPDSEAHVEIFRLVVKFLCDPQYHDEAQEGLSFHQYAALFWCHHFVKIDIESLQDGDFASVLEGLRRILNNDNNVAAAMENATSSLAHIDYRHGSDLLQDSLRDCFTKAGANSAIDNQAKDWVKDFIGNPNEAILTLARAHVQNWLTAEDYTHCMNAFRLARSALLFAGVEITDANTESDTTDIYRVLEHFNGLEMNATALKNVSEVLYGREAHQEVLETSKQALELESTDPFIHFTCLWNLARSHWELGRMLEGQATSNTADENPPNEPFHDASNLTPVNQDSQQTECQVSNQTTECSEPVESLQSRETVDSVTATIPPSSVEKYNLALDAINQALSLLPEDRYQDDAVRARDVESVLCLRADVQKSLHRFDDSLESFRECRRIRPDWDNMEPYELYREADTKNWDGESAAFMDLVGSWSESERHKWFGYLFDTSVDKGFRTLQKHAATAGPERWEEAIKWMDNYITKVGPSSSESVAPRSSLADFYAWVLRDDRKAIELYKKIIDQKYDDRTYDYLNWYLMTTNLDIADVIFQKFRRLSDPLNKAKLLEELKPYDYDKDCFERHNTDHIEYENRRDIILAMMERTVGSQTKSYELWQKSFTRCINGLSDEFGWNDAVSWKCLAKTLTCVPGLEREAQIALSCMFYITDPSVRHADEDESENGESDIEDAGGDQLPDQLEVLGAENELTGGGETRKDTVEGVGKVTAELQEVRITETPAASVIEHVMVTMDIVVESNGVIEIAKTQGDAGFEHSVLMQDKAEITSQILPVDTTTSPSLQGDTTKEAKAMSRVFDSDSGEDLIPERHRDFCCAGPCDAEFSDWSGLDGPIYFCVHCGWDTFLCSRCYEVRFLRYE